MNDIKKGEELSDLEKELALEDYVKGKIIDIYGSRFVVVSNNDNKTITIEPLDHIWYKTHFDKKTKNIIYSFIEDGKIVRRPG
jgi:hypothetical protein